MGLISPELRFFVRLCVGKEASITISMENASTEQAGKAQEGEDEVRALDLTGVERIVRGRMPGLEMVYDRFVRAARAQFSRQLGVNCSVELASLGQEKYGPWLQKYSPPLCAHRISIKPLKGSGVILFSPLLASQLVDLLMGGKGKFASPKREREYSDIERRLLAKFISALLEDFGSAWEPIARLQPSYQLMESSPQALSLAAPTDWVSTAKINVELLGRVSDLEIALPVFSLSPLREKLEAVGSGSTAEADSASQIKLKEHLARTEVSLSVVLAEGKITAREVLNLKVGDVVELGVSADEDATIKVEGKPKFRAKIGALRGSRAATVTKKIS
ncbi:MAG: flagellar motor switch protein FliM [Bdellovibrionales bacterium]|nr:flagellar motor switch protein FliM [Bdellovibrionales bacterium]